MKGFNNGINLGGWLSQSPMTKEHLGNYIDEKDIESIKSMGADHIRLPIDYMLVEDDDGAPKISGYIYIDNCVNWCEKYSLNIVIDLHRTYGYSFNEAAECKGFWESKECHDRFLRLWGRLSQRYGKYPHVAFDILNEIVDDSVCDIWNNLAAKAITVIRKNAPDNWIIVGGTRYNSIFTVKDISDFHSPKIAYSFHFYEPYIFTHQGACWESFMPENFRVSYPLTAEEYCQVAKEKLDGQCMGIFMCMSPDASGAVMLDSLFGTAVTVAAKRSVPLYCGEYGVISNADDASAKRYISDLQGILEKHNIGRAMWNYKGLNFGIESKNFTPQL